MPQTAKGATDLNITKNKHIVLINVFMWYNFKTTVKYTHT